MVSKAGVTSPIRTVPYITPDMFKFHGRRGVQVNNLVPQGNARQQDAALLGFIEAASSWADGIVGPAVMAATQDTVQENVNISRDGFATIYPRYRPVVGLIDFWIGPHAGQLAQIVNFDAVDIQIDHFKVPVHGGALLSSSEGPIQFGPVVAPYDRALARYTYVNGYPVTLLTADAAAATTTLEVADTTGVVAGKTWMTVYALERRLGSLVTAVSTADAGGLGSGPGTLTLATAVPAALTVSDQPYAPMVSAMPPSLIEAIVLATRAMIKESGGGNVAATSATSRSAAQARNPSGAGDDFAEAEAILRKFFVLDA